MRNYLTQSLLRVTAIPIITLFLTLSFPHLLVAEQAALDEHTVLLIHSDHTDQSTNIEDSSRSAHAIGTSGVIHSSAESQFGATSLSFHEKSYLNINVHGNWNFRRKDFTIDFWIHPTSTDGGAILSNLDWIDEQYSGIRLFRTHRGDLKVTIGPNHRRFDAKLVKSEWAHIAVVRHNGFVKVFKNGLQVGEDWKMRYLVYSTRTLHVGRQKSSNKYFFNGYLDELRISKGIARWIENFSPPTTPYSNEQESINSSPSAAIHVDTASGPAPLAVRFDGSSSYDEDGVIVSHEWNFDNGITATGPTVGITFNSPGSYLVSLTVADDRGAKSTVTLPIEVSESRVGPYINAQGWTVFPLSQDALVIYVSSSEGSDQNDGRSPQTAVQTITKGYSLLRDGFPDRLLLKRGDTWKRSTALLLTKSGRSEQEPMLISAYSEGNRPQVRTHYGMHRKNTTTAFTEHLAITGIELYASHRDPNSEDFDLVMADSAGQIGFRWGNAPGQDFLMENCKISFFTTNLIWQGPKENPVQKVRFRRNVIANAWVTDDRTGGLGALISGARGILVEDNIFDKNGYNDQVEGALPSWFNHHMYCVKCHDLQIKGNIFSRGPDGLKIRSDITAGSTNIVIEDNLFFQLGGGISMGDRKDQPYTHSDVSIRDNVFLNMGIMLFSEGPHVAKGMSFVSLENALVEGNYFLKKLDQESNDFVAKFNENYPHRNILVHQNTIFQFTGINTTQDPIRVSSEDAENVVIENNIIDPLADTFVAPERSLESYHASIGEAPMSEAFFERAQHQSQSNWDTAYTAGGVNGYIKDGFQLK